MIPFHAVCKFASKRTFVKDPHWVRTNKVKITRITRQKKKNMKKLLTTNEVMFYASLRELNWALEISRQVFAPSNCYFTEKSPWVPLTKYLQEELTVFNELASYL